MDIGRRENAFARDVIDLISRLAGRTPDWIVKKKRRNDAEECKAQPELLNIRQFAERPRHKRPYGFAPTRRRRCQILYAFTHLRVYTLRGFRRPLLSVYSVYSVVRLRFAFSRACSHSRN